MAKKRRKRNFGEENARRNVGVERCLRLLVVVSQYGSLTLAQAAERFDGVVCKRTVMRDLAVLVRIGIVIPDCGIDGKTVWRWTGSMNLENALSPMQKAAI
jgi:hypothetical protein